MFVVLTLVTLSGPERVKMKECRVDMWFISLILSEEKKWKTQTRRYCAHLLQIHVDFLRLLFCKQHNMKSTNYVIRCAMIWFTYSSSWYVVCRGVRSNTGQVILLMLFTKSNNRICHAKLLQISQAANPACYGIKRMLFRVMHDEINLTSRVVHMQKKVIQFSLH